jgi:hypothetical protein
VTYGFTFTVTDTTKDHNVGLSLTNTSGTLTSYYTTVTSGETATSIAAAISALISASSGITVSAATAVVTAHLSSAGALWYPSGIFGGDYADSTPTSSPGTDLDAIRLVDDDWYGTTGAIESAADITAVAVWVAANQKTHYYTSADTANFTSNSGIFDTLRDAGYKRSYGQFGGNPLQYGASGLEALEFTYPPGTYTDAFKGLQGVTVDALTPSQKTGITANNGNYYVNIGGVDATFDGRSAQGQFMDLTRFLDALKNDIQIRVFTLIANSPKVPYDSIGIAAIGGEIRASLSSFVRIGALSNDPGFQPQVALPNIADISTSDKQARTLTGVKFSCTYTNAIHSVSIQGTVSL